MKRYIKRIICAILCLCMLLGTLSLVSCTDEESSGKKNNGGDSTEETIVTAVRIKRAMKANERLVRNDLQEVQVYTSDLPAGAVTNIKDAIGKYLSTDVVAGEYVLSGKISEKKGVGTSSSGDVLGTEDYIIVTDYIKMGTDVSESLQKLINENPNKTLYFPDGTYRFSKSITTSADPKKTVSLRLSNYAIFTPSSDFEHVEGQGLVRLGATDKPKTANAAAATGNSFYFMGGIIDMQGKGTAISVEGGRDILINNFAIRKSDIGIHIQTDYVDVDSGVVAGSGTDGYKAKTTIGVLVEGSYNTINNMRICSITRGIMLTEGNNVLRNLHPLYTTTKDDESAGFWDESTGNFYDYCYSDNFAIGFHLADGNVSVLNGCFSFWYSDSPLRHWGIRQEGKFNSIVRNTRIDMCDSDKDSANPDNAYIWVEQTGGKGAIVDPIGGGGDHATYLNTYKK